MKVVIIDGSPRAEGVTGKILRELAHRLEAQGDVDVELYSLWELDIAYCTGCGECHRTGSCFLEDDAERISRSIAAADGIILGSPTFTGNVSGRLKVLLDRGHFVMEQLLRGRYVLTVTNCEHPWGHMASRYLNRFCIFAGGILTGKIAIRIPFDAEPMDNPKVMEVIAAESTRFYASMRKGGRQRLTHRLVWLAAFHLAVCPAAMREQEKYAGVLENWKKRGILGQEL